MGDMRMVNYLTDRSILEDPYLYYEFVREQGPVWREPHYGAFVVTGCEEISAIDRDHETYSSCNTFAGPFARFPEESEGDDIGGLIEKYRYTFPNGLSFITWDPPRHTAHRGLMMRLLTPKRLLENEAFIMRLADQQIGSFAADGSCDFVAQYAQPLAMLVIADLLGIPEEDHADLRAAFVAHPTPGTVDKRFEGANILDFLERWFTGYIEDRRREPRDDILTHIAHAPFPDGSTPEVIDVVRVGTLLFAAGQGTAARFLTNAVRMLAECPELQQQLRCERDRIPQFVEEMLRFNSPVKVHFRMARVKTSLAGVEIPAGSTLMLLLGAAGRDPKRFSCPAEFDIDRSNVREHLAFGRGVHACPGGPLVRAEGRITIECLLDRLVDIRISEAAHGPAGARRFDYTPSFILHGLESLHLEFTPGSASGSAARGHRHESRS